ncbi:GNAT family N-acetyltransferase, partial [Streptococcus sp. DD11]
MLVRVSREEAPILRELEVATYQETFGPFIKEADMAHYFAHELSLATIETELADPESEHYFVLDADQKIAGFLKFNWGQAQTEHELDHAFEIQRIYVLASHQGQGLGKELFDFALEEARKRGFDWAWLGV